MKKTKEYYITEAKKVHNDSYTYLDVFNENRYNFFKLKCNKCGFEFVQRTDSHLTGNGCPQCAKETSKLSLEEFINKSNQIHNNFYDYSLVKYINNKTKVKIICPIHGVFEQNPECHYSGKGCPICGRERSNKAKSHTLKEFIDISNKIHNNKYDYSLVDYKNNHTEVKIICKKHGVFEQLPLTHLRGNGCRKCSYEDGRKPCLTQEEFLKRSIAAHDDKYDYSLAIYTKARAKVKIICPKHGVFEQSAWSHFRGKGCSLCNESKGEKNIKKYLEKNNILFEVQKSFKDCKNIGLLFFDFYLPEHNICIEFQGIQHYEAVKYWKGEEGLIKQQKRDQIKRDFCINNNITLLEIKYDDDIEKEIGKYV